MRTIDLTLRLTRDDDCADGFPVVDALAITDLLQGFSVAREGDDVYGPLPTEAVESGNIPAQRVLFVRADTAPARLRLGQQTTSNIPLETGGCLLVWTGYLQGPGEVTASVETHLTGWVAGLKLEAY